MQETCEFQLREIYDRWNKERFEASVIQLLDVYNKELAICLSYYYKSEGGLVEDVRFEGNLTVTSPTTGYFQVSFNVVYFNACLDIHQLNKDFMVLQMNLVTDTNKIKISGPVLPEREPDEI